MISVVQRDRILLSVPCYVLVLLLAACWHRTARQNTSNLPLLLHRIRFMVHVLFLAYLEPPLRAHLRRSRPMNWTLLIFCALRLVLRKSKSRILILHILLLEVVQLDHWELFLQRCSSLLFDESCPLGWVATACSMLKKATFTRSFWGWSHVKSGPLSSIVSLGLRSLTTLRRIANWIPLILTNVVWFAIRMMSWKS